ncbi:MAG: DUF3592 domain-containing protein [Bacillota bacterium]
MVDRRLKTGTRWMFGGGLILIIGLVVLFTGFFQISLEARFLSTGLMARGTVLEKQTESRSRQPGIRRWYLRYRFIGESGQVAEGKGQVPWTLWDQATVGGPVIVQYLPANPRRNRVFGQTGWGSSLITTTIGVMVLVAGYSFWRKGWLLKRYLQHLTTTGSPALGTVVAIREKVSSWSNSKLWAVQYRYEDHLGQEHQGETDSFYPAEVQHLREGDVGEVLYDPARPANSLWVGQH